MSSFPNIQCPIGTERSQVGHGSVSLPLYVIVEVLSMPGCLDASLTLLLKSLHKHCFTTLNNLDLGLCIDACIIVFQRIVLKGNVLGQNQLIS